MNDAPPPPKSWRDRALAWSAVALVAVTWVSTAIFGAYILAYYGGAAVDGTFQRWNDTLPGLHVPDGPSANAGIGIHFLGGGVLLLLGPIQLLTGGRERATAWHRRLGRVFVLAAGLAAIGGLAFVLLRGTIGGFVMDLGFGLYGVLMLVAAVETARHAIAGRFDRHRAWGVRLFALVVGSWLYRIEYGVWFMLFGTAGHTDQFSGPFDLFMAFAFYLPNLAVAELWLRARSKPSPALQAVAIAVLAGVTAFLVVGTYFFTREFWGPEIVARLSG